jgi:SAM-dependent methyltransferase
LERLDSQTAPQDGYLEASIHLARYASVSHLVENKKVLDVGTGEGLGAAFLERFKPAQLSAVDISAEAIDKAKKSFGESRINFLVADATSLDTKFAPGEFDLVTCFEVFEHVEDPIRLLGQLRKITSPGGTIAISCPNDDWYYPEATSSNPFHIRKYSFQEFRQTTESVLGKSQYWMSGVPTIGFENALFFPHSEADTLGTTWLQVQESQSFTVGNIQDPLKQERTPSYWIGVWGSSEINEAGAHSQISMETLNSYYETAEQWSERVPSIGRLQAELNLTSLRLQLKVEENRLLVEFLKKEESVKKFRKKTAKSFIARLVHAYTPFAKKVIPQPLQGIVYKSLRWLIN